MSAASQLARTRPWDLDQSNDNGWRLGFARRIVPVLSPLNNMCNIARKRGSKKIEKPDNYSGSPFQTWKSSPVRNFGCLSSGIAPHARLNTSPGGLFESRDCTTLAVDRTVCNAWELLNGRFADYSRRVRKGRGRKGPTDWKVPEYKYSSMVL